MHKYCGGGGGGGGVYIHVCLCLVLVLYGAYKNVEVCGGTLCMCICTKSVEDSIGAGVYACIHACMNVCACMYAHVSA